ncbi:HAD family hydrolase [Pseudonocardia sp.]|uniref:HAD family hydrolase n=1 Tax=Pseudonocardia sp. TaxID=60912 RepID=UPI00261E9050|nr:HAD family hydrolase [Pseudonocardia sp.]
MSGRVLLLDLDGTVCLGDGPARRYATEVGARLAAPHRDDLAADLAAFLAGEVRGRAQDAYQLVQAHAARCGLAAAEVSGAYLASRDALLAGEVEVEAPCGLVALLAELRPAVHVVLLTNAPAFGLEVLLARLGLDDVVDETIGDAGKPGGMAAVLDELLGRFRIEGEPWRLLSVGDVWENDLAGPAERGCATAYVDRFGLRQGPAGAAAATVEGLYPAIRAWASGARLPLNGFR